MSTKTINIKDVAGNDIISRDRGKKLRKMIEQYWKSADKIIVDFSGLS